MTDTDLDPARGSVARRALLLAAGLGAGLAVAPAAAAGAPGLDAAALNFALQLAYLQAEFHGRAAYGVGLGADLASGPGAAGAVSGGRAVRFSSGAVAAAATEIADDLKNHVIALRGRLGALALARPALDVGASFATAAAAAGIIGGAGSFDPYENDLSFLFASFVLADLGATALNGLLPLIAGRPLVAFAGGLLGTRAYHAATVRTLIFSQGIPLANSITAQFAALQARLSGAADAQGVGADQSRLDGGFPSPADITPTDPNGLAFSRRPRQVLDVVYGARGAGRGLFFPAGINAGPNGAALLAS